MSPVGSTPRRGAGGLRPLCPRGRTWLLRSHQRLTALLLSSQRCRRARTPPGLSTAQSTETPASLSCQLHYKRAQPCEPGPTLQLENMGGTCMECLGGTTVCNSWEKQMSYNRPCGRVVTTVRETKHDGVCIANIEVP